MILREAVRAAGCSRKQPSIHPDPLRHPGQGEGSPGEAGPRLRLVAGWLCRRTVRMAAPAPPPVILTLSNVEGEESYAKRIGGISLTGGAAHLQLPHHQRLVRCISWDYASCLGPRVYF
jgi:hypothetical protein